MASRAHLYVYECGQCSYRVTRSNVASVAAAGQLHKTVSHNGGMVIVGIPEVTPIA